MRRVLGWLRKPVVHERWAVFVLGVLAFSRPERWVLIVLAPVVLYLVLPWSRALSWLLVPPGPGEASPFRRDG
ncbi:hypothetical protein [Phycicoccus sp.]|uniref:hypothetical protein n=1 Tax=Phycicoccus sp. TaxID=1902410 RepID=UPI002CB6229A|nr:hypothetical protein [Phycicoccus sp.]HMM95292.1 hypothetical protein [Phycicoccus sp.]